MSVIHASAQKAYQAFQETWKTWSIKSKFIFKGKKSYYVNLILGCQFRGVSNITAALCTLFVAAKFCFHLFSMFSSLNSEKTNFKGDV